MDPSGRGWKAGPGLGIFEHIRKVCVFWGPWFYCYRQHWLELQSDIYFKVHLKLACFSCVWDGKFKIALKNWSLSVTRNSLSCRTTGLSLFHKMPKHLFKEDFAWFIMFLLPAACERFAWFLHSCHWMILIPTTVFKFIYCEGKNPAWNISIFVGCPWLLVKTRTLPYYKNPNMPFLAES